MQWRTMDRGAAADMSHENDQSCNYERVLKSRPDVPMPLQCLPNPIKPPPPCSCTPS